LDQLILIPKDPNAANGSLTPVLLQHTNAGDILDEYIVPKKGKTRFLSFVICTIHRSH